MAIPLNDSTYDILLTSINLITYFYHMLIQTFLCMLLPWCSQGLQQSFEDMIGIVSYNTLSTHYPCAGCPGGGAMDSHSIRAVRFPWWGSTNRSVFVMFVKKLKPGNYTSSLDGLSSVHMFFSFTIAIWEYLGCICHIFGQAQIYPNIRR